MDWINGLTDAGGSGTAVAWLPLAGLVSMVLILAAAEALWPLHRDQRDSAARIPGNFGLGLLNMGLAAFLPVTGVAAAEWSRSQGFGLLHWLETPSAVSILATLAVRSLLGYGLHRLAHRAPLLWRMHKVHHCDTAIDLSTGLRHHPLEVIYVASLSAGVAGLLGLSPVALAIYEILALGFGLWSHANTSLPQAADRALATLLVTPAVHHVHHSAHQPETDSNYGDVSTVWDRVFGTYCGPPHEEVRRLRFGLGDAHDTDAANLFSQLLSPFRTTRSEASDQR